MKKIISIFILILINGTVSVLGKEVGHSPYPILFVHGIFSSHETWNEILGYNSNGITINDPNIQDVYGSYSPDENVIHFVLNATANTHIFGADEIQNDAWDLSIPNPYFSDDDVRFRFQNGELQILPGNIFAINFRASIKLDGGLDTNTPNSIPGQSYSNMSAIIKQEYAIGQAIRKIRDVTGKDKVVIVAHSMGGLAARGYLQRTILGTSTPRWWVDPNSSDGHKVALLVTLGTPHQGANLGEKINELSLLNLVEGNVFLSLVASITGWDNAEATRDLRWMHTTGGQNTPGGYLYNTSEVNLSSYSNDFYNIDVNSDGVINSTVQPLNKYGTTTFNDQMPLPTNNIRFVWVTSDILLSVSGDGIVDENRQWLYDSNGNPTPIGVAERIQMSKFHTSETSDLQTIVKAIDEPDEQNFAYNIDFNTRYSGLITHQPNMMNIDRDYYTFEKTQSGTGLVVLFNGAPNGYSGITQATLIAPDASETTVTFPLSAQKQVFAIPDAQTGIYYLKVKGLANLVGAFLSNYTFEVLDVGNVGKFVDGWHSDGSSQAFFDRYVNVLMSLKAGDPDASLTLYDRGYGTYVYQRTLTYSSQTLNVYVQDYQDNNSAWWQMPYNPNDATVYPLHGQLLTWWNIYGAQVGYPISEEVFGDYAGGGELEGPDIIGAVGKAGDQLVIQLFHYTKTSNDQVPFNTVCYNNSSGAYLGHYAVGRYKVDGLYGKQWFAKEAGSSTEVEWPYNGKKAPTGTWWTDAGSYQFYWKDVSGNPQDLVNDLIQEGNSHFGNPGDPTMFAPSNLIADASTETEILLSWNEADNPTGTTYSIFNITTGEDPITGITDVSYTVTGLLPKTGYSFQVSTVYSSLESARSNVASIMTKSDGSSGGSSTGIGTLSVFSSVVPSSSAKAYINGNNIGNLPVVDHALSSGSHTLAISAPGYTDYQETISIVDAQNTSITGYLAPTAFPLTIQAEGMQHYAPVSGVYLQLQNSDQNWYGYTYTDLPEAGRIRVDAYLKAGGQVNGIWPKIEMPGYENSVQTVNTTNDTVIVFYKDISQAITGYEWKIQLDEVTRGIDGMMVEVDKLVATYVQPQTNPVLAVSPDTLNLGTNLSGTFSVSNAGDGLLQWAVISEDTTMSFDVTSGSNNSDVVVTIDTLGMTIGHYVRPITFLSSAGNIEAFIAWEKVEVQPIVYDGTLDVNFDDGDLSLFTLTGGVGIDNGRLKLTGDGLTYTKESFTGDVVVRVDFDNGADGRSNQHTDFRFCVSDDSSSYYRWYVSDDSFNGGERKRVSCTRVGGTDGGASLYSRNMYLPDYLPATIEFGVKGDTLFFRSISSEGFDDYIIDTDLTREGRVGLWVNEETSWFDNLLIVPEIVEEITPELTCVDSLYLGTSESGLLSDSLDVSSTTGFTGTITTTGALQIDSTEINLIENENRKYQVFVDLDPLNTGSYVDTLRISNSSEVFECLVLYEKTVQHVSSNFADWTHRCEITFDQAMVSGNQDLVNFQLVITEVDLPADMFTYAQANGIDVRFTLDTLGTQELSYERVSFESSSTEFHVLLPTMYANQNTTLYVWYGNANASDVSTNTVWNGLAGVWHMNEQSGNALDSSPNANNLVNNNSITAGSGKISGARDFDGGNYEYFSVDDAAQSGLEFTDDFTVALWTKFASIPSMGRRGLAAKYNYPSQRGFTFDLLYTGSALYLELIISQNATADMSLHVPWEPLVDTWYHVAVTYDMSAGTAKFYVDGIQHGSDQTGGYTSLINNDAPFTLGEQNLNPPDHMDGLMDEVRIYPYVLPGDWIATMYANQSGVGSYSTVIEDTSATQELELRDDVIAYYNFMVADRDINFVTGVAGIAHLLTVSSPDACYVFDRNGNNTSDWFETNVDGAMNGATAFTLGIRFSMSEAVTVDPFGRWYNGENSLIVEWEAGGDILVFIANSPTDGGSNYVKFHYDRTLNQVYELVVTYDAGAVNLYIDGVVQSQTGGAGTIPGALTGIPGRNLLIGNYITQTKNPSLRGNVYEAVVYNTALSATEVADDVFNIYQDTTVSAIPENTIGLWTFDGLLGSNEKQVNQVTNQMVTEGSVTSTTGHASDADGAYAVTKNQSYLITDLDEELDGVSELTVAGWFYFNAGENHRPIGRWNAGANSVLPFDVKSTGKILSFVANNTSDGGSNYSYTNIGVITFDAWHHLAFVYDGNQQNIDLYIDGNEAPLSITGTISSTLPTCGSGYPFVIGNSQPSAYGGSMNGAVSEVIILNEALNAQNVMNLYMGDPFEVPSTIFGEWHFNGTAGTTDKRANAISGGDPVVPTNMSSTSGKEGGADESYAFNGTGYLQTGLDDELDSISEITVAMWVKTDATSYDQLFGRWNVGYRQIAGGWHTGNRLNFTLAQNVNDTGGNSNAYATQGFTRDTGWHHIVYVYNGNVDPEDRVKIYYDNVALNMTIEGTIPTQLTIVGSSAYQLVLGNIEQSTSGGHVGSMDYTTIDLAAWSANDVATNYQQAVAKYKNFAAKIEVPTQYSLEHNYPNPFNPTTTIKYGLPQNVGVQLVVYNVRGQVIKTLVDEHKTAGYHTVSFNANQLASGVYIYKLQVGTFVMTHKMLLIK